MQGAYLLRLCEEIFNKCIGRALSIALSMVCQWELGEWDGIIYWYLLKFVDIFH